MKSGILNLLYIGTQNNFADVFTNSLHKPVHQDLTYEIGVLPDQG